MLNFVHGLRSLPAGNTATRGVVGTFLFLSLDTMAKS